MKNAQESLYLMADGTYAAAGEVSKRKDGVLTNKSGVPVALRDDGEPYTLGHGLATNKNVEAAEVGESDLAPPDIVDDGDKDPSEVGKTEIDPTTGKKEGEEPDVLDPADEPAPDKAPAKPSEPAKAAKR